jgi:hypothetical protein
MNQILNLHIPPGTYPGRVLDNLRVLYHQNAAIQEQTIRESRLETLRNAIDFMEKGYTKEDDSQRFQVHRDGNIYVNNTSVSNLRIFFD